MSDILNKTAYEYGDSFLSDIDELHALSQYANEIACDIELIARMADEVECRIMTNNVGQASEDAQSLAEYLASVERRLRGDADANGD